MPMPSLNIEERRTQSPEVAVSIVVFAIRPPAALVAPHTADPDRELRLWLPLVRRLREPYADDWALPGGPLAWDRSLDQVASDTLVGTTGLPARHLEQLYSFGATGRSATAPRLVTIAYWALLALDQPLIAEGVDHVAWFPADALPRLAFDHRDIVDVALARLRAKTAYADIAARFLGPEFTLAELRQVHDAVLGTVSDPANFRRRLLASGQVEPSGAMRREGAHRPARLFRFTPEPTPREQDDA